MRTSLLRKHNPFVLLPKFRQREEWRFFWQAKHAWRSMYAACLRAEETIDFEQYILRPDRISMKFMNLFMRKARRGVKVRLLCDMMGSWELYFSGKAKELREAGVAIRFFNPIRVHTLFNHRKTLPRNHCKTMIVDGKVGFTGGVCFDERMHDWRDTHVRLESPIVDQMQKSFDHFWQHKRGLYPVSPEEGETFSYVTANPFFCRNAIYRQLLEKIAGARKRILLTTPYLIPSRKLLAAMRAAVLRGVDVRLLVSAKSDVPIAQIVSHSYLGAVIKSGVRVWLYGDSILHAKSVVVDSDWATVGSMNLDHLSLFRNYEGNVIIRKRDAVQELERQFMKDFKRSEEWTLATWQSRPLWEKAIGRLGRVVKHLL